MSKLFPGELARVPYLIRLLILGACSCALLFLIIISLAPSEPAYGSRSLIAVCLFSIAVTVLRLSAADLPRLRGMAWNPWLVLLLFVPIANLVMQILLLVTPSRTAAPGPQKEPSKTSSLPIVVAVVIGCLVVSGVVVGTLELGAINKKLSAAQVGLARNQVEVKLEGALEAYRLDTGDYPTVAEGLAALWSAPASKGDIWHGPYLDGSKPPVDPWGRAYRYTYPGIHNKDGYDLWSSGPDGVDGSPDDITNWDGR